MGKYINYKNADGLSKNLNLLPNKDTNPVALLMMLLTFCGMLGLFHLITVKQPDSIKFNNGKFQKVDSVRNNLKNVTMFEANQKAR